MKLSGAAILVECLIEQGVDTVFGYPGGAVLYIYDELYKNSHRINHILTAHEQAAAHAADGYSRSSGRVGVCLATSGPGATNLVTGIATAYMDSIPMVAITGNVATALLGKDSFQEADIAGITAPITKHNFIVKDVADLAATVRRAFVIAQSGRPGPVLIDIPKDVSAAVWEFENKKPAAIKRFKPKKEEVDAAVELINSSRRPFIFAGGGVVRSNASEELIAFARKINAPIACSLMGLGSYPAGDPLFTGMLGMHGTKASNTAASNCDLFIAIGSRFSDRVISDPKMFAPKAKILHIEADPAEIDKNIRVDAAVLGDAKEALAPLARSVATAEHAEWLAEIDELKRRFEIGKAHLEEFNPNGLMKQIARLTGGDAIITTEVGQHQMWAAQYYPFTSPRRFITSGGFGTMGFGTGAAMGAALAMPGRQVVHIAGDGSFRMNCNELSTIRRYNIPVIIVIVNNKTLGMVRQWQTIFYEKRYSHTTLEIGPDFNKLANAYDIPSYKAATEAEFETAMTQALGAGGPAVINTLIGIDERVLPMVPAGKPIDELILE